MVCPDCGVPREGSKARGRCPSCSKTNSREGSRAWNRSPEGKARRNARARARYATPEGRRKAAAHDADYRRRIGFETALLYAAKSRAKKQGVAFSLSIADVTVPDFCPVFGIPLERSGGLANPNLASLDRIEPSLGYVPGNVWVISWRANKLKSDATVQELRNLLAAIDRRVS